MSSLSPAYPILALHCSTSCLARMEDIHLWVIHLLKDVRSFTISQRDALSAELKCGHLPIFLFLGLETVDSENQAPGNSQSHIFMGNPMIMDEQKMQEIRYDSRWHSRRDWVLSAILFPHIMTYNSEAVYGGKPQYSRI